MVYTKASLYPIENVPLFVEILPLPSLSGSGS